MELIKIALIATAMLYCPSQLAAQPARQEGQSATPETLSSLPSSRRRANSASLPLMKQGTPRPPAQKFPKIDLREQESNWSSSMLRQSGERNRTFGIPTSTIRFFPEPKLTDRKTEPGLGDVSDVHNILPLEFTQITPLPKPSVPIADPRNAAHQVPKSLQQFEKNSKTALPAPPDSRPLPATPDSRPVPGWDSLSDDFKPAQPVAKRIASVPQAGPKAKVVNSSFQLNGLGEAPWKASGLANVRPAFKATAAPRSTKRKPHVGAPPNRPTNKGLIERLAIKPINQLKLNTKIKSSDEAPIDYSATYFETLQNLEYIRGCNVECRWHQQGPTAADFCYQPLFWEEINLERHGRNAGLLQPAFSATRFFGTFPLLPIKAKRQAPRRHVGKSSPYPAGLPAPKVKEVSLRHQNHRLRNHASRRCKQEPSTCAPCSATAEPIGIQPIGIESIGIDPIGIQQMGIDPIGVESIGAKSTGAKSIGQKDKSSLQVTTDPETK